MPFFAGIHVCKGKHRHDICQSGGSHETIYTSWNIKWNKLSPKSLIPGSKLYLTENFLNIY